MPVSPLLLSAPGAIYYKNQNRGILEFGRSLRDELVWQYPIVPDAIKTFQDIASSREFQIIAKSARAGSRAMEWVNEAKTYNTDGTVEYGFEQYMRRRVLDYLCVGRTAFCFEEDEPLRYLDGTELTYDMEHKRWVNGMVDEEYFDVDEICINHPVPIGASGRFMMPLYQTIPLAILSWLINEHDTAASDGRKIREIFITTAPELSEQLEEAIKETVELWAGVKASENGVSVISLDQVGQGMKASDLIYRMGLANVPEAVDRKYVDWKLANTTANATGLSLRHIWNLNSDTSNRSLEEVQETRGTLKGPNAFVRTEERLMNDSGALRRFGNRQNVRFQFIEETDLASRDINSRVAKAYSETAKNLADIAISTSQGNNPKINKLIESIFEWLKTENVLPPDLELLSSVELQRSNQVPVDQEQIQSWNTVMPDQNDSEGKTGKKKQPEKLKKGFYVIDRNCQIVDKRLEIFSFERAIKDEKLSIPKAEKRSFVELLEAGRKRLREQFESIDWDNAAQHDLELRETVLRARSEDLPDAERMAAIRKSIQIVNGGSILPVANKDK